MQLIWLLKGCGSAGERQTVRERERCESEWQIAFLLPTLLAARASPNTVIMPPVELKALGHSVFFVTKVLDVVDLFQPLVKYFGAPQDQQSKTHINQVWAICWYIMRQLKLVLPFEISFPSESLASWRHFGQSCKLWAWPPVVTVEFCMNVMKYFDFFRYLIHLCYQTRHFHLLVSTVYDSAGQCIDIVSDIVLDCGYRKCCLYLVLAAIQ